MNIETNRGEAPRAISQASPSPRPPEKSDGQMMVVFASVVLVTAVWIGVLIYFALEVAQRLKG